MSTHSTDTSCSSRREVWRRPLRVIVVQFSCHCAVEFQRFEANRIFHVPSNSERKFLRMKILLGNCLPCLKIVRPTVKSEYCCIVSCKLKSTSSYFIPIIRIIIRVFTLLHSCVLRQVLMKL